MTYGVSVNEVEKLHFRTNPARQAYYESVVTASRCALAEVNRKNEKLTVGTFPKFIEFLLENGLASANEVEGDFKFETEAKLLYTKFAGENGWIVPFREAMMLYVLFEDFDVVFDTDYVASPIHAEVLCRQLNHQIYSAEPKSPEPKDNVKYSRTGQKQDDVDVTDEPGPSAGTERIIKEEPVLSKKREGAVLKRVSNMRQKKN